MHPVEESHLAFVNLWCSPFNSFEDTQFPNFSSTNPVSCPNQFAKIEGATGRSEVGKPEASSN